MRNYFLYSVSVKFLNLKTGLDKQNGWPAMQEPCCRFENNDPMISTFDKSSRTLSSIVQRALVLRDDTSRTERNVVLRLLPKYGNTLDANNNDSPNSHSNNSSCGTIDEFNENLRHLANERDGIDSNYDVSKTKSLCSKFLESRSYIISEAESDDSRFYSRTLHTKTDDGKNVSSVSSNDSRGWSNLSVKSELEIKGDLDRRFELEKKSTCSPHSSGGRALKETQARAPPTGGKLFTIRPKPSKMAQVVKRVQFAAGDQAKVTKREPSDIPRDGASNNGYDDADGYYISIIHDVIAQRYEILKVLGQGSFGQVVKAYDHKEKKYVGIKIVRNDDKFYKQALEEIEMLKMLNLEDADERANIVRMLDYFIFRKHICICFELLSLDLYEMIRLNRFRGLPVKLVRRIATSVLRCLDLLRSCRVIHCDLKPENILLKKLGHSGVKVIDFGSSCFQHDRLFSYVQSRFYRSPEVILGAGYDYAIDMWSFGCVLVELVTGTPLFPGEDEGDQLACMMECLGHPPMRLLQRSKRANVFFSTTTGYPRYCTAVLGPDGQVQLNGCVTRRGRKRGPPGSVDLIEKLDETVASYPGFVNFLRSCLEWDPYDRITPSAALQHEWIVTHYSSHSNSSL